MNSKQEHGLKTGHVSKSSKIKKGLRLTSLAFAVSFTILMLAGCKATPTSSVQNYAMGTSLRIDLYGNTNEEVSKNILTKVSQLEYTQISHRSKGSDVYRLNNERVLTFDGESLGTYGYIVTALDMANKSEGAFNPTLGDLDSLWETAIEEKKVPDDQQIQAAKANDNYKNVSVNEEAHIISILGGGEKVDLGASGKGIACDVISGYLDTLNNKPTGAICSVGGSVLVWGKNPKSSHWSIGIRDPRGTSNEYSAILKLDATCISTSGDYEKYFEDESGKRYHHILDPSTGYPVENDLMSVTAVYENGEMTDILSTTGFVMGKDKGMEFFKSCGAEGVFITKDKKVYVTDGLKDKIEIEKGKGYVLGE